MKSGGGRATSEPKPDWCFVETTGSVCSNYRIHDGGGGGEASLNI